MSDSTNESHPIKERSYREIREALQDHENHVYVATINTPGYLPQSDETPTFESARDAWEYLLIEREIAEDEVEYPDGQYSETATNLRYAVNAISMQSDRAIAEAGLNQDGTGTIGGNTPGYDGLHDLGLNYSVTLVPRESAPNDDD